MAAVIGSRMRGVRKTRANGEDGSTLVEFAMMSGLFFLTVLGTMEYARMVFNSNMVSFAAREGARYAAVRGSTAGANTASVSDIQAYTAGRSVGVVAAGDVTVFCGTMAANITTSCSTNNQPGKYVQVRAQATFSTGVPLLPVHSVVLSSKAQLLISR
jgi:Flp pilus assembly protein TadG